MKNLLYIFEVLLVALLFTNCDKNHDTNPQIPDNEKSAKVIAASNQFGTDIFKLINSSETDTNLFISPLSISLALSMAYNGANGETKTEMENALRFNGLSTNDINVINHDLINALSSLDNNVIFDVANSIWYRNNFSVEQAFIDTNQYYYDAEVSSLDFGDPNSVSIINSWVSDNTNHLIPTIINQIPAEAVMYIINATYFKGTWKYTFDEESTYDQTFLLSDNSYITVPTMHQTNGTNYLSTDIFNAIELPYGEQGKYSMLVFVPNQNHVVNDIVNELTPENLTTWYNQFSMVDSLHISLPKFKFGYEITLNEILKAMGMQLAFSDYADFTGIHSEGNIFISKVFHKSFVDVNEQGTEAAAVTSIEFETTSIGNEVYFFVDRPFVFLIKEKKTGAIIFIGKVVKPVIE